MPRPTNRKRRSPFGLDRWVPAGQLHLATVSIPLMVDAVGGHRLGEPALQSVRPSPPAHAGHPIEWADQDMPPPKIQFGPKADGLRDRLIKLLTETADAAGIKVAPSANHSLRLDFGSHDIAYATVHERALLPPSSKQAHRLGRQISASAVQYHASQILAAARLYHGWHAAWSREIKLPRKASEPVRIWLGRSVRPSAKQLSSLLSAVERGSDLRIEVRWRQLTPAARAFLHLAVSDHNLGLRQAGAQQAPEDRARAHRKANQMLDFRAGPLVFSQVPARTALSRALPLGIELAKRRRTRVFDREEALLKVCRSAFLAVTLGTDDKMIEGREETPGGVGAAFVQAVEHILGIRCLPENSLHMIKRLRVEARMSTRKAKN